jgi:hypothetical protein
MEDKETAPVERAMPYASALGEVVKGLRNDPVLLYGIGAGIIVVGVLVFTASTAIVLIVAALFVVVLFARGHQDAQRIQKKGTVVDARVVGSSLDDSDVGNVAQAGADTTVRAKVGFSRMKHSRVGNVGGSEQQQTPED